jgi:hypothetical protein
MASSGVDVLEGEVCAAALAVEPRHPHRPAQRIHSFGATMKTLVRPLRLGLATLVGSAMLLLAGPLAAKDLIRITGAGASFPAPLYQRRLSEYFHAHPNVRVDYQAIGSGAGITNLLGGRLDFAGTDLALSEAELARSGGGIAARAAAGRVDRWPTRPDSVISAAGREAHAGHGGPSATPTGDGILSLPMIDGGPASPSPASTWGAEATMVVAAETGGSTCPSASACPIPKARDGDD